MRGALQGQPQDSGNSELRTAVVAAFLAEGLAIFAHSYQPHDVRSSPAGRPYTTSAGTALFSRLIACSGSVPNGKHGRRVYSSSGAKGADVKNAKKHGPSLDTGADTPTEWNYRWLPAASCFPRFAATTYGSSVRPQPFQQSRSALNALAQNALDKECGAVCMWLSHKFYLRAVEQYPDADRDTRFP